MPLFLKNYSDLETWLQARAIDAHRANSRLLKRALRLAERDDVNTVLYVHGVTITDNYWIRPVGSKLSYEEIKFDNDYFAGLALHGRYNSFQKASQAKHTKTPELTNRNFSGCLSSCPCPDEEKVCRRTGMEPLPDAFGKVKISFV